MEHLYHFDLNQDPFQNEPDLRFYFESGAHRRAQLRVDRALRQSKGLTLLTGEGGTGKSLLARRIYEELEEEIFEAALMVMMKGTADATSVLRRFAAQLGVDEPAMERPALLAQLYDHLAIVREDGRHAVLILDDADVLGRDAMAEIGGLLNLEYEDRRLVSLLLVGMPDLDAIVAGVPSLGQRIDVRVPLQPLAEADAVAYLDHRIQAANGDPAIFEEAAFGAIYKLGGGRPRQMNTLADNAIFEAYLAGRKKVGVADVEAAGADLGLGACAATSPPAAVESVAVAVNEPVATAAVAAAPVTIERAPVAAPRVESIAVPEPAPVAEATLEPIEPQEAVHFAALARGAEPESELLPTSPAMAEVTSRITDDEADAVVEGGALLLGEEDAVAEFADLPGAARSEFDDDDDLGSLLDEQESSADLAAALHLDNSLGQDLDLDDPLDPDADLFAGVGARSTDLEIPTAQQASAELEPEIVADETDAEEIDNLFVELLED